MPLSTHGYVQAPYIPITEERYDEIMSSLGDLEISGNTHEIDDKFCSNDSCAL